MKQTDLLKLLETIERYVGKSEASFELRKQIQSWNPPEGPGGTATALDDPPEGPGGD